MRSNIEAKEPKKPGKSGDRLQSGFSEAIPRWNTATGGMRILIAVLLLTGVISLCAASLNAAAPEPYGLNAITRFDRMPYIKLDTIAGGQSSYDRSGGNGDWNNFLYTDGADKVMLDLAGPGTVYRIWCTGFNAATDYIKVYFDGEAAPRIHLLLKDLFSGTSAPFLAPLVGNDTVSSGGFFCYLPLPFKRSIKIVSNSSFYYNIGYHLYSPDTSIATWTGAEDSSAARNLWSNAGADPKSDTGNVISSNIIDVAAGTTQTLADLAGPASISSIKIRIPGINPAVSQPSITDSGRAFTGYSQFRVAVQPANAGVRLTRRLDYGIADQKANVYVDGALVGAWSDSRSDLSYQWRNSSFDIPPVFTAGKSSIAIKVLFVSSSTDWNEFYYWIYSKVGGTNVLTDALDIGTPDSEASHNYVINAQAWSGTRTYEYPPPPPANNEILTNVWLKITFDHESIPSVNAPIGSFFAMGQFAPYSTKGLPVGLDAATNLYVYFPMPFASHATVQLASRRSASTTNIFYEIRQKPFGGAFTDVGYFKTSFQSEEPTTNGSDIVILDTEGAGHLVGVVESMMGPVDRNYLEGDERIYVDGSLTPAFYGTGTEDFYNAGWYFNRGLFTLPTHGCTAHLGNTNYDYTSAYRLFLQDAIPFRKHLRVGIEHGGTDNVSENVWTLAYYYYRPEPRAVLTDQLDVGNTASETSHSYAVQNQTWSGVQTSSYDGDQDTVNITDDGRAYRGSSQFTLSLQSANQGAILRRRFDQGTMNQQANVYVDGTLAGVWYHAGGNTIHRWRDDDFLIPSSCTAGKSSIHVKVQSLSSSNDWNEFNYSLYTLAPPNQPPQVSSKASGLTAR